MWCRGGCASFPGQDFHECLREEHRPADAALLGKGRHTFEQTLLKTHGNALKSRASFCPAPLALDTSPSLLLRRSQWTRFFHHQRLVKLLGGLGKLTRGHLPIRLFFLGRCRHLKRRFASTKWKIPHLLLQQNGDAFNPDRLCHVVKGVLALV
jgi:hypothetical protein